MEMNDDRNAEIAKQILARKTMARGVVVLDVGLFDLEQALIDANVKVVKLPTGWSDADIKKSLLFHRIIVTRVPGDFVDDAPVYEYGVIALDKLASIDAAPSYRTNKTIHLLSKAMSQYGLWEKGAKFFLQLREDGSHVLKELS